MRKRKKRLVNGTVVLMNIRRLVGTALTLQTSIGFLLTLITIEGVPRVVGWMGWPWAFAGLALGPAFGIVAIRRWQRFTGSA